MTILHLGFRVEGNCRSGAVYVQNILTKLWLHQVYLIAICRRDRSEAGQGRAGQGRAGQGRAGQGRADQGRARHGRSGQGRVKQGEAGQGRTGQSRSRQLSVSGGAVGKQA